MKNKTTTVAILMLGFGIASVHAQQASTTAGGDASGSGGTIAFSVGQIVYNTNSSSTNLEIQGVQQPYEISIVLGMNDNQISLNLQAYPNPTSDLLTLSIGNLELSEMNFQLLDFNGKIIERKTISSSTEFIRLEHLPTATYFLKVTKNNKEIKTFKITKN